MEEAYNKNTPVDPYRNFWLRLVDDIVPEYAGRVEMIFIPDGFLPTRRAKKDPGLAASFFTSQFLEHFIGHNYGDILRENPTLEKLVVFLHSQVQREGRKQEVPTYPYDYLRYRKWQMEVDQKYNFS